MDAFRRIDHNNPQRLDRLLKQGELIALYPGILFPGREPITLSALVGAARLVDPDAIAVGEGARLLGWAAREAEARGSGWAIPTPLVLASRRQLRGTSEHLRFVRQTIPEQFVIDRGEVRFTAPEYTAVDLIPEHAGEVVDEVLRQAGLNSAASLELMRDALVAMGCRRGNAERRRVLHASRGRPWSEAERQVHHHLRQWAMTGWVANHPVFLGGRLWFIDVAFPKARIALEFDSREFHSDSFVFERDRVKLNELEVADWRTLQITWRMLEEPDRIRRWLRALLPKLHEPESPIKLNPRRG